MSRSFSPVTYGKTKYVPLTEANEAIRRIISGCSLKEIWIARKPDGGLEFVTFNPIETPRETERYRELGWVWAKFVKSSDK